MATEFVTFSAEHLVTAVVVLGGAAGLAVAVRASRSARAERVARWLLAGACVVQKAYEIAWPLSQGVRWQDVLPLHLCDLSIVLVPVVLLTANRFAFELLYFWGIGGALQSIATPTLDTGFPTRLCMCFFLGHALIIASALYATVVMRLRPTARSLLRVWLVTTGYALVVFPLNFWLETNYLYIAHKPFTPSLLDWLGPWPWYLLSLQLMVVLVMGLCYLPFLVLDWRARRLAKAPAAHYHTPGPPPLP